MAASTPADLPQLHRVTLAYVDAAEERDYAAYRLQRQSRRRYAEAALVSALLWTALGLWFRAEFPLHRDRIMFLFFGVCVAVILVTTLILFLLPPNAAR